MTINRKKPTFGYSQVTTNFLRLSDGYVAKILYLTEDLILHSLFYIGWNIFFFFFFFGFGLSQLTSLQFIQYHVAGFYKPTILQSYLQDYSTTQHATMPG
jgi:hypothetical protein